MYDLAVYGHLTVDRIFDNVSESVTLGAIGNFWEACLLTESKLFVDIKPMCIGEAIIYINKEKGTRHGRGVLNLLNRKVDINPECGWSHIMYLNQLEDASFIKEISNSNSIISADLTSGQMKNVEYFKYLDYLFISDEDLFMDLEDLAKMVKGWVILHYPAGSVCHNGDTFYKAETSVVKDLNVLGAGDFFAASFIADKIKNNSNMEKTIKFSHENTKKLLLRRKNGK